MNSAKLASWAADPDILRVVRSVADQLDPALRAAVDAGDPSAILHAYNQARRLPSGRLPSAVAGERVAAAGPGPGSRLRSGRIGPDDPASGVSIIGNDDPISFGVDVSPSSAVDDSFLARIAGEASPSPYVSASFPADNPITVGFNPSEFGSTSVAGPSGSVLDFAGAEDFAPSRYAGNANEYRVLPTRPFVRRSTADAPSGRAQRLLRDMPPEAAVDEFGAAVDPKLSSVSATDIDLPPGSMRDIYPRQPASNPEVRAVDEAVAPARPEESSNAGSTVRPEDNTDSVVDDLADGSPGGSVEPEVVFTPDPWAPKPASQAFGWTKADGTPGGVQKTAQFVSRNRYPIGLVGGIGGLYGLNAMLNGESYAPIPAPPGYGASADDDAQQAEDAAMSQASVAANESPILPPQETVDPVPLESLDGAPEFDVGTPELGQPPVEVLGSIMAAADSFMPEDSDPSPQAEEQLAPGPELAGRELGDAIMKLNREFDRGSITPEAAMTDPVYSRIPGDKLRRLVARGQDLAERQYRRKQAGIFSATNPYGRATQLAAAMYALAPEDRDAFMAHYTLGGPPGQVVSYMDARRDRESGERMKDAELATSERNARTEARSLTSVAGLNAYSTIAKSYYEAQAAKQNAMAQLALVRQQMRNAEMQHREAMQRGDAAAAERARQFALQYQQGATQLEVAIGSLDLKRQEMNASQVPQAARVAEQILAGPVGQQMRQAAQQAQRGDNWSRPMSRDEARGVLHRKFGGHTNDVYERILEDVYGPVATN